MNDRGQGLVLGRTDPKVIGAGLLVMAIVIVGLAGLICYGLRTTSTDAGISMFGMGHSMTAPK